MHSAPSPACRWLDWVDNTSNEITSYKQYKTFIQQPLYAQYKYSVRCNCSSIHCNSCYNLCKCTLVPHPVHWHCTGCTEHEWQPTCRHADWWLNTAGWCCTWLDRTHWVVSFLDQSFTETKDDLSPMLSLTNRSHASSPISLFIFELAKKWSDFRSSKLNL